MDGSENLVLCRQQRRLGSDGARVMSGMDCDGGSPQSGVPEISLSL